MDVCRRKLEIFCGLPHAGMDLSVYLSNVALSHGGNKTLKKCLLKAKWFQAFACPSWHLFFLVILSLAHSDLWLPK
jgi:hypothetical protein